jgi:hypothetical protein
MLRVPYDCTVSVQCYIISWKTCLVNIGISSASRDISLYSTIYTISLPIHMQSNLNGNKQTNKYTRRQTNKQADRHHLQTELPCTLARMRGQYHPQSPFRWSATPALGTRLMCCAELGVARGRQVSQSKGILLISL